MALFDCALLKPVMLAVVSNGSTSFAELEASFMLAYRKLQADFEFRAYFKR